MKNRILILSGDPNSINSELIFKSWKKLNKPLKKKILIVSNYNLLKKQFEILGYKINLKKLKNIDEIPSSKKLNVIDLKLKFKNPFKVSKLSASKFINNSLNYAHDLAIKNKVKAIINCSISKNLLKKGNPGVTEFLASKCRIKDNSEVMLIRNKKLSVSPITTHINVDKISKKISKKLIINKIKTLSTWYQNRYKKKPKIGILGLNPHNAELRKDSEEKKIIIPAINKLKKIGYNVRGPIVSDTVFISEYKKYKIIIGMYHDQVLTPFKALFKFEAINITLGLKYLRVSPDHGTAIKLIKKNKANPISLLQCINFIDKG